MKIGTVIEPVLCLAPRCYTVRGQPVNIIVVPCAFVRKTYYPAHHHKRVILVYER